jgi:hypothetical protein
MDAGAFRDEAGHLSAEITGSTSTDTSDAEYTFWSDTVATPVIRVNRVSTNSATEEPVRSAQVRIDSETPGAAITYTIQPNGVAVDKSTTSTSDNSFMWNNPDSAMEALTGLSPGTPYSVTLSVGDGDYYTGRKDYVAAKAVKNGFSPSGTGYEGVFKSLIIYRLPANGNNGGFNAGGNVFRYLKLEGATIDHAASHIAGFPMKNNDMTGKSSLYTYKKGVMDTPNDNVIEWVWISYEIVSDWYQCALFTRSATNFNVINASGIDDGNAWEGNPHIRRTYGTAYLNGGWGNRGTPSAQN